MTTLTAHDHGDLAPARADRGLRQLLTGAAAFDGLMGVACLVFAGRFADWLGIGTTTVRETGVVFLFAAIVGDLTVWRRSRDVRWIAAANLAFAAWCLAIIGFDSPNALGVVLLVVSAVSAAGLAWAERRLATT